VEGRLIYDNTTSTDVYGAVQAKMRLYFPLSSAGRRVTYSTIGANPFWWEDGQGHNSNGFDCSSVYGYSAMVIHQSELQAAFAGGKIGRPGGVEDPPGSFHGLACYNDPSPMYTFPHPVATPPVVHDTHYYACLDSGGACYPVDSWPTARNFYNAMRTFITYHQLACHQVIVGETSEVQDPGCAGHDYMQARANVKGWSLSNLFLATPSTTVLRVWYSEPTSINPDPPHNVCYASQVISPPYTP
jgi:hypothetical protein